MTNDSWLIEYRQGHFQRAAELLQSLAESCDAEGLLALGTMYFNGMHLFDSEAEFVRFMDSGNSDQKRQFWEANEDARIRGLRLLEKASQNGSWVAPHNLWGYYSACEEEGMTAQERAEKTRHYYECYDKKACVSGSPETHAERGVKREPFSTPTSHHITSLVLPLRTKDCRKSPLIVLLQKVAQDEGKQEFSVFRSSQLGQGGEE
jgi:hypothetical protein